MAVSATLSPVMTDYPAQFRGYVVRSTQYNLTRIQQAGVILSADDRDQALHTLSYALKLSEAWPGARELLLVIAPKMEQAGYRDEWIPYLRQGIQQGQRLGDFEAEAELHFQLGVLYQLRNKYDEAQVHLDFSVVGFKRLNARPGQARALNRLAYLARLQRHYEEASRLVETVRQILRAEDEEWAFSEYVLGLVALDKRDWPEAIARSRKSCAIWEQAANRRMMGRSLLCLGVALEKMDNYSEAMTICQQAVSLFAEIKDFFYQAIAQMNLGNVYLALAQVNEALETYLSAERKFRRVQDRLHLAHVNHNIGLSNRRLQHWHEAREAYLSSIELWRQLGNIERLVNSMDGLGLTYLEEGNPETAKVVFKEVLDLLGRIEGEPGYQHWFETVTTHFQQASQMISIRYQPENQH